MLRKNYSEMKNRTEIIFWRTNILKNLFKLARFLQTNKCSELHSNFVQPFLFSIRHPKHVLLPTEAKLRPSKKEYLWTETSISFKPDSSRLKYTLRPSGQTKALAPEYRRPIQKLSSTSLEVILSPGSISTAFFIKSETRHNVKRSLSFQNARREKWVAYWRKSG